MGCQFLGVVKGFSVSTNTQMARSRPVRGSTSFGSTLTDGRGSSTALYAKEKALKKKKASTKTATKKKKKKKKKKFAVVEANPPAIVMKQEEQPPVVALEQPIVTATPSTEEVLEKKIKAKEESSFSKDGVYLGPQVEIPDILDFDLTGGRPQVVIESEEDLARRDKIFQEIESGDRKYPKWFNDYGVLEEELTAEYDTDDPDAIDASTLGTYDYSDMQAKFDYEYDPETDPDPNLITDTTDFIEENEKDDEGIEVGYDPLFGPSNPVDVRTKTGAGESYMIAKDTRNEEMLTPEFLPGDPEIEFNEEVIQLRKSMDIIETYIDEFLPDDLVVPRHVAKWHGYNEPSRFPAKNYTNNRFTAKGQLTNFDELSPFRARTRAVELARSKNAEWMPDGFSQEYHKDQRQPYEDAGTLVGTLRKGDCDAGIVELIKPALSVLGSSVELLSIEQDTVFRFHYYGLMKNKHGMACWTETLIRDCGAEVTGVIFETGFRRRDPAYDGGDPYYGFS